MRLILIDNHSRLIFGDTANYRLGGLDEWRDSNSDDSSVKSRPTATPFRDPGALKNLG